MKSQPYNICIIRLSSLGDIIHTLPAFNIIRNNFKGAKISWIVEKSGALLLENFNGIDQIITFKIKNKPFLKKLFYLKSFLKKHKNQFDIIIDFQGLIKSSILSFLLKGKAGKTIGFPKNNLREPFASHFYNHPPLPQIPEIHVIKKNIKLLKALDCNLEEIAYPLKNIKISDLLTNFYKTNKIQTNQYLVFNIGAGFETKQLTVTMYISILKQIQDFFPVIILWGNSQEKKTAELISKETNVLIAPFLNFTELIYLIKMARLVFTSDTLALHLSDLTNTKSLAIFSSTSPQRNGSLLPGSSSIHKNLNCSFCYKRKCAKMECINSLDLKQIAKDINNEYNKIY